MTITIYLTTHMIMLFCMLAILPNILNVLQMAAMKPRKKLTRTQVQTLEILLISVFSTAIMSGGVLWIKEGIGQDFLRLWMKEFFTACCVSIPSGYVIVPLVMHYTQRYKE